MAMKEYDEIAKRAADAYAIDPKLVRAAMHTESKYDSEAKSGKGAGGLMQLMPKTAEYLGVTDIHDPEQNIMGGTRYLYEMLQQFDGNEDLALAAYNAGPTAVRKYKGIPPFPETREFVKKVRRRKFLLETFPDAEDLEGMEYFINDLNMRLQYRRDVKMEDIYGPMPQLLRTVDLAALRTIIDNPNSISAIGSIMYAGMELTLGIPKRLLMKQLRGEYESTTGDPLADIFNEIVYDPMTYATGGTWGMAKAATMSMMIGTKGMRELAKSAAKAIRRGSAEYLGYVMDEDILQHGVMGGLHRKVTQRDILTNNKSLHDVLEEIQAGYFRGYPEPRSTRLSRRDMDAISFYRAGPSGAKAGGLPSFGKVSMRVKKSELPEYIKRGHMEPYNYTGEVNLYTAVDEITATQMDWKLQLDALNDIKERAPQIIQRYERNKTLRDEAEKRLLTILREKFRMKASRLWPVENAAGRLRDVWSENPSELVADTFREIRGAANENTIDSATAMLTAKYGQDAVDELSAAYRAYYQRQNIVQQSAEEATKARNIDASITSHRANQPTVKMGHEFEDRLAGKRAVVRKPRSPSTLDVEGQNYVSRRMDQPLRTAGEHPILSKDAPFEIDLVQTRGISAQTIDEAYWTLKDAGVRGKFLVGGLEYVPGRVRPGYNMVRKLKVELKDVQNWQNNFSGNGGLYIANNRSDFLLQLNEMLGKKTSKGVEGAVSTWDEADLFMRRGVLHEFKKQGKISQRQLDYAVESYMRLKSNGGWSRYNPYQWSELQAPEAHFHFLDQQWLNLQSDLLKETDTLYETIWDVRNAIDAGDLLLDASLTRRFNAAERSLRATIKHWDSVYDASRMNEVYLTDAYEDALDDIDLPLEEAWDPDWADDGLMLTDDAAALEAFAPEIPAAPVEKGFLKLADDVKQNSWLDQQLSESLGSNPGGLFKAADGNTYYVKFYHDEAQSLNELVANEAYRRLGNPVPESVLVNSPGDTLAIANKWVGKGKGEKLIGALDEIPLTPERAKLALEGFIEDVWLANWDVAGMTLDNMMVVKKGGKEVLYRIDNGGSLLFRAQGKMKPEKALSQITEMEGFLDPAVNPAYAKLAKKAGFTMNEAKALLKKKVKDIQKLQKKTDNFADMIPVLDDPELDKIRAELIKTLNERALALTKMVE